MLGASFLYASWGEIQVGFDKSKTGGISTLVMAAIIALLIPTIISFADNDANSSLPTSPIAEPDLVLSRVTAIALLCLFVVYLVFRFRTHVALFDKETSLSRVLSVTPHLWETQLEFAPGTVSLTAILISTAAAAVLCTNYLIQSIEGATRAVNITQSFVGLVFLPLVGNLGKSFRIVLSSKKKALALEIRSIMTNVVDTLLFITPTLVLFGWIIDEPMNIVFGFFDAIVFLLAIIIMTHLLQYPKTTYFEGFMLIGT